MRQGKHEALHFDGSQASMNDGAKEARNSVAIRMGRRDRLFTLDTRLVIPLPRESLFPFFADAGNLESITPPWLHFQILTPLPIEMRTGTIIEYRLQLHGIGLRWLTEITSWEPPCRFTDEQRQGPYRKWIHEHIFTERNGACEMQDFVQYSAPGGWLVDRLFVKRNVRRIFEYRAHKLLGIFAPQTEGNPLLI
jgi:ligand-binding SRPBCC domain-containing protein